MKLNFFFAALLSGAVCLQAQDTWMQVDSVKGPPKSVCAAFTLNGLGYIATGLDSTGFTRRMYSYDYVQNDWDNELSLGGANGGGLSRGSAVGFSIFNKGYVCTGQGDNTNFLNDTWEYDPVLDVWTQKADFLGSARRNAVCFVIDNIAYVGTGEDASGLRKDFYKYDPVNNIWGVIADFGGTPRKKAVAFALGNLGYVGTGDDGVVRNDLWQYQVFQNTWTQKANMPGTARCGAVGWGTFPTGFIATGEDITGTYKNDVWEYNYFTNQWIQRTSIPAPGRKHAFVFMLNNIAFVGCGYNGDFMDDCYAYTPLVGITEQTNETLVKTYPNPATTHITIQLNGQPYNRSSLQLYNAGGQNVTAQCDVTANASGFTVQVEALAAGNYFYVIADAETAVPVHGSFVVKK